MRSEKRVGFHNLLKSKKNSKKIFFVSSLNTNRIFDKKKRRLVIVTHRFSTYDLLASGGQRGGEVMSKGRRGCVKNRYRLSGLSKCAVSCNLAIEKLDFNSVDFSFKIENVFYMIKKNYSI